MLKHIRKFFRDTRPSYLVDSRDSRGKMPPALRESRIAMLRRLLGIRQRYRAGNAVFKELDTTPLWEALYAADPRGYKDYEVTFDDGFAMHLRQTREQSFEDIRGASELFHYKKIKEYLRPGMRVLDAACGTGYGARWLADRGAVVSGVDLSDQAVTFARHRYPHIDISLSDVCVLPFPQSCFDLVMSVETFEHVSTPEKFVAEVARVLRPLGLWFITLPLRSACQCPYHVREYSREDLIDLLRNYFEVDRTVRWLNESDRFIEALFVRRGSER